MSDKKRKTESADILSALTIEQLNDILSNEFMSDETDFELIKRVNLALNAKSGDNMKFDVDAKWQEFQNDYVGTEPLYDIAEGPVANRTSKPAAQRKIRLPIGVAAAIIAVIVLMSGTLTAHALGYEVFGAIATWTKDTFSFTQQTETNPGFAAEPENMPGISDLQSALDEYGITEKLVPAYIPKGYEQTEFYVDEANDCTLFTAVLENADETIIMQIRKNSAAKNRADYEKDGEDPEIYIVSGIPHCIMTNMGEYRAVWVNGLFEASVSGLSAKDELIKMIDSIYELQKAEMDVDPPYKQGQS